MKLIKLIYWTVQGYVDAKMGVSFRLLNVIVPCRRYLAYSTGWHVAKGDEV